MQQATTHDVTRCPPVGAAAVCVCDDVGGVSFSPSIVLVNRLRAVASIVLARLMPTRLVIIITINSELETMLTSAGREGDMIIHIFIRQVALLA